MGAETPEEIHAPLADVAMNRYCAQVVGMPLGQIEQLLLECLHHLGSPERPLILQSLFHQGQLLERVQAVVGAHDVPRLLEGRGRERMVALRCQKHSELGQRVDQIG